MIILTKLTAWLGVALAAVAVAFSRRHHRALIVLPALLLSGCKTIKDLPDGTQIQSSTFGIKISPTAPDGTPLVLGSHTLILTTPQPPDVSPNLNRFQGSAPGVDIRSTVASGAVGEQLKSIGPDGLRALLAQPSAATTAASVGDSLESDWRPRSTTSYDDPPVPDVFVLPEITERIQ